MMSLEEFKRIVDQVRGYTTKIVLFNYGEPFLNKDVLKMAKYAFDAGISIKMSTNGHFFQDKNFCKEVIKSGLHTLIVSLDGADQETHVKYRKGANFDVVVQGIKNIVEAKKELNSKLPKIELQFLVMKHNEHQRKEMRRLAENLGVDFYDEKTVGLDAMDPNFQKTAEDLLPGDSTMNRYSRDKNGKYELKGEMPNYCSIVNSSMVINCDGSVVPCCYDEYLQNVMGNAFKQGIREIWRGEKYQRFRELIKSNRKSIPMCNICPEGRYKEVYKRQKIR